MKKTFFLTLLTLVTSISLYSQRDSLYMFDMTAGAEAKKLAVYLYLNDGIIDHKKTFAYFEKGSNKALAKRQVPKECRIKIDKNKKAPEHSYIFTYPAINGVVSKANYSPKSKMYYFYTELDKLKDWKIIEFIFAYQDKNSKKPTAVQLVYRSIATGSVKTRIHELK